MNKEIPLLTASDVDLRVAQLIQTKNGTYANLLVYKNARVDMKILDEVFGPMNWARSHSVIDGRLFCTVSVWDEVKEQWVSKQDVGVPSNAEATKGEASDAFKRACFNLGIGRELYSAPDIRIKLNDDEVLVGNNGKPKTYAKFYVADDMQYDKEQNRFTRFTVLDKDGRERYRVKEAKQVINEDNHKNYSKPPFGEAVNADEAVCQSCHAAIKSPKVIDYAMNKYGKPICYECQKRMAR